MSGVTAVLKPARTRLLHVAEDVGSGPVVLLIHGIASTAATFTHLTPLLAANHRVISIELLGFGESPDGTTYSIEEHVDWLERTIRSLKLKTFTVIGHSLGGLLMARYARRNPNRVERLIMVNPPIFLDPEDIGDRTERLAANAYLRSYQFLRANKDFTLRNFKVVARLLPIKGALVVAEHDWDPFKRTMRHCIEEQTTVSDVGSIDTPIDIVYCSTDYLVLNRALRLIGRFRHVTLHRLRGGDHLISPRVARSIANVLRHGTLKPPPEPHEAE